MYLKESLLPRDLQLHLQLLREGNPKAALLLFFSISFYPHPSSPHPPGKPHLPPEESQFPQNHHPAEARRPDFGRTRSRLTLRNASWLLSSRTSSTHLLAPHPHPL